MAQGAPRETARGAMKVPPGSEYQANTALQNERGGWAPVDHDQIPGPGAAFFNVLSLMADWGGGARLREFLFPNASGSRANRLALNHGRSSPAI